MEDNINPTLQDVKEASLEDVSKLELVAQKNEMMRNYDKQIKALRKELNMCKEFLEENDKELKFTKDLLKYFYNQVV